MDGVIVPDAKTTAADRTSRAGDGPTDAELLAGLRRRRSEALETVAARYGGALARVASLQLGDAHAAEDAAQEALIAAWDGARRTTDATRLRPWLYGIVLNRCRKHLRTLARRRRREKAAARAEATDIAAREGADADVAALARALALLAPEFREVVVLRHERGLSVAEAAEALGIPEGTVKSRCHAALARLRVILEADHGPEA